MAGYCFNHLSFGILLLVHLSYQDNPPRVETKSGAVIGTEREADDGKMIYSFQGIPYIKAPIGELRFKPPVPIDSWAGDFSATSDAAVCLQKLFGPVMGSEDCIMLNVYTPWNPSSSPPNKPLSVMVFIHGGGFIGGASGTFMGGHPDYLLHHDVVLVTFNYRVGVLGFLSTEDEAAPGNYGLLDQVEALRWVKNNVASFGGNPDDVTLFGESAGSASVHYHMLSPLSKGLFHRAIAQSGTSICPWASTRISGNFAKALAKKVGCPEEPSRELVECLKVIDGSQLVSTDIILPEESTYPLPAITWSPRIDPEAAEPFLPKHPIELMRSGEYNKVPLLIGHTRTEGAMYFVTGKEMYDLTVTLINNNWDGYCKHNLAMAEFLVPEKKASKLCNQVRDVYIGDSKSFEENKMKYLDLLGDAAFTSGIYKSSELMSKHSLVYNYVFNYESEEQYFMKVLFPGGQKVDGAVCHADDLLYVFKYPQTGWTKESPEFHMVEMVTKIWTDFAKTGEPSISELNSSWPKATWPDHKYVVIDSQPTIQQNYRTDKMELFEDIYSNSVYKTAFNERDEL